MKIAVLMSTYNGDKFIKQQLDSILRQVGDFDLDIYIRDDGSNDNTLNIIKSYNLSNIILSTGKNLKSAKSFMELIYTIKSYDYYALCDQDDIWDSDKLICGIEQLKLFNSGPALYFSNAELVDRNDNLLSQHVYNKKPKINFYSIFVSANALGCTMIYNSKLASFIQNNEKPNIIIMHDSFIIRTCLAVSGKVIYDSNPHMHYRQHENNVIGIETGFKAKLKNRMNGIFKKEKISIEDQAKEILRIYGNTIEEKNKKWIYKISIYKKNIIKRISLAFSFKIRFISFNMALMIRLQILLGNR